MGEIQRFFRYIIPGLIFVLEASLIFVLTGKIRFGQLIELGKDFGFVISALLVSGGVGFLIGIFYYTLIWQRPFIRFGADHRSILKDAINRQWVQLQNRYNRADIDVNKVSQRGAWRVAVSYWNSRVGNSESLKAATPRVDRLSDIAHGSGTTFLGSCLVVIVWLIHNLFTGWTRSDLWIIALLSASGLHFLNFRGVIKDYQEIFNAILENEIRLEYQKNKKKIVIEMSPGDLEGKSNKTTEKSKRGAAMSDRLGIKMVKDMSIALLGSAALLLTITLAIITATISESVLKSLRYQVLFSAISLILSILVGTIALSIIISGVEESATNMPHERSARWLTGIQFWLFLIGMSLMLWAIIIRLF
jgi:hypothetical protein